MYIFPVCMCLCLSVINVCMRAFLTCMCVSVLRCEKCVYICPVTMYLC